MPVSGTLIGLTRRGEPIYGLMHQPFIREHFSGDGRGARYRGPAGDRDLRVRRLRFAWRRHPRHHQPATDARRRPAMLRPRRKDGAAVTLWRRLLRLLRAAAGQVDLVIETELKPHDVLPLIPIIEGAGGIITTWENGRAHNGGRIVAAGDRRVHVQAMEVLNS